MSETDMKTDIKRVMNRVKKRAVPANGDGIRTSGIEE